MVPGNKALWDKLAHFIELANEGIWSLDEDGRTDYINERGAAMLGYRPEEMIGRPPSDFRVPGIDDDRQLEAFQKAQVRMREHCMLHRDGSTVWAIGSTFPISDESGGYKGTLAVLIDVTGQRKALEELKKSEERFRALVTASSDLIYRVSGDWTELLEARGGEMQETRNEAFEDWLARVIPPEERPHMMATIDRALSNKEAFKVEHRAMTADGKEAWVISTAVPIMDASGNITEWFGMVKDITRRKDADDALRKSKRRFELLSETNSILLSSREPEKVIQSIAGKVLRHLNCDVFSSYFLDELQGRLRLTAYHGVSRHTAEELEWIDPGTSISGLVVRDGHSMICEDMQHSVDVPASLLRSLGLQAYACFPIKIGERTIGTLAFGSRERQRFDADEIALMRIVSEQVSVSIKRRRAELAVKEREEHFARAQRIAHMGSFSWDIRRGMVYMSDEACRLSGISERQNMIKKDEILALIHPEDVESFSRTIDKGLATGICEFDHRIKRPDGGIRYFRGQAVVTYDLLGQPAKMVGTAQDVTESKIMEMRLREKERYLTQAHEIAHLGSWVWDMRDGELQASDEMYRIFGLDPGEQVKVSYDEYLSFVHPDDRHRVNEHRITSQDLDSYELEYRIVRRNGEVRHIHTHSSIVRGKDGAPALIFGTIQDITERKQAEERLRESETHLARAQRIAHMGSWEWDVEHDQICFSDEAYRIAGIERAGAIVRNADALAIVHPEDREIVAKKAEDALRHGAYEIEYRIIRRDGEVRFIRDIGEVSEGLEPRRLVGTLQDITERKQAEERLREKEEHLALAQEIAHLGSWVWDLEQDRLLASDEGFRIFGLQPNEVQMNYGIFLSFVHPEDRKRVLDNAQLAYSQDIAEIDYRIIRKDGEVREIHSRGVVLRGTDGKPSKVTGIIQDITDRVKMERAVIENQQMYQSLIETDVDFIWEMDAQGRYTYCSPQMEKQWGIKPQAMIGRSPFELMPPDIRAQFLERFSSQAADPRGFRDLESVSRDGEGNTIYIETSGVPFFDEEGRLKGFRGISRDITNKKKAGLSSETSSPR